MKQWHRGWSSPSLFVSVVDAFLRHRTEIERGAGAAQFTFLTDEQRADILGDEYFIHQELPGAHAANLLGDLNGA